MNKFCHINVTTLVGKNYVANRNIVLLSSAFATMFFLCTSPFYFAGGAGSFFVYAQSIVSGQHTLDIIQRDIGFPLMLVVSGFPWTGSIFGITAIHAVMALFIPVIVHAAVGRVHPRVALFAGLACVVSLVPYQFLKMMYHDQTYLFFTTLSALVFVYYVRTRNPLYFYVLTLLMLMSSFTRPAGNYVFPMMIACAYIVYSKPLRHYFICTLLFTVLAFANYEHRRFIIGLGEGEAMPSYTGPQVFYNLYTHSSEWGIELSADMGPGMQQLYNEIKKEFGPNPALHPRLIRYKELSPAFYRDALDVSDPAILAQRIFHRSLVEYFTIFQEIPAVSYDNGLFLRASWEIVRQYPLYPLEYTLRNLEYYFFKPGYGGMRMHDVVTMGRNNPEYYPRISGIALERGLTQKALKEMSYVPLEGHFTFLKKLEMKIYSCWWNNYGYLNTITTVLLGFGVVGMLSTLISRRASSLILRRQAVAKKVDDITLSMLGVFMLLFYNALVTSMFVDPIYRYQYMSMPLQLICAGYGLVALGEWGSRIINVYRGSVLTKG